MAFEIDAGLAFGTGQHATTAGCLAALDLLERNGCKRFTNIADIGTGTGLLAFAAMALWPEAKAIATDVDPIAIDVTRDNAAINRVPLGHGPGELLLAVADGMDHPLIAARAPFDLLIANILAGPLIDLAPAFAKSVAPGASVVLAGLLDTQADAVIAAYEAEGMKLVERGDGRMVRAGARSRLMSAFDSAMQHDSDCADSRRTTDHAMLAATIHNHREIMRQLTVRLARFDLRFTDTSATARSRMTSTTPFVRAELPVIEASSAGKCRRGDGLQRRAVEAVSH